MGRGRCPGRVRVGAAAAVRAGVSPWGRGGAVGKTGRVACVKSRRRGSVHSAFSGGGVVVVCAPRSVGPRNESIEESGTHTVEGFGGHE